MTYTLALKRVLELEGDSGNGFRIGLDRYPIFDENYRDSLNRKIIAHFWNRAIGVATISEFTFNLRRKMNEMMPLYNQLYKSELITFTPLTTIDIITERDDVTTDDVTRDSTAHNTSDTKQKSKSSTYSPPQTRTSGQEDYASGGAGAASEAAVIGDTTGTDKTEGKSSLSGNSRTTGRQGSAAAELNRLRGTFLNLDMDVIRELNEMFMLIWDNGEEMLLERGY